MNAARPLRRAVLTLVPLVPVLFAGAVLSFVAPCSSSQADAGYAAPRMLRADTVGPGWTAESLANLEVGMRPGRSVSYRFRADRDGAVRALRVYFIFRTRCSKGCYAAGNGGAIRVEIREDDATPSHLPAAMALASALVSDPLAHWNRLIPFPQPPVLQAGRLYHLVFSNVAADPVANFVSIDDLYTAADGTDLQPAAHETDLAVLLRPSSSAEWETKSHHIPIFTLDYEDGSRQGQGYIDMKQTGILIAPESSVREGFTLRAAVAPVALLGIRVKPLSTIGSLRLTLATRSGRTLHSAVVTPDRASGGPVWVTDRLSSPIALAPGTACVLILASEAGGRYLTQPLQQGTAYGFAAASTFHESHCEVSSGRGWENCLNRPDLDIPFFLRTVPRESQSGQYEPPGN